MVSIKYLETVIAPILKKNGEKAYEDFMRALEYVKFGNYDDYNYGYKYDKHPDEYIQDTFTDVISNITIVVELDTILDVGDDCEETKTLGEVIHDRLYYSLSGIYGECAYDDGFLEIDDKGNIKIMTMCDDYDSLINSISDDTGYMVMSLKYRLELL